MEIVPTSYLYILIGILLAVIIIQAFILVEHRWRLNLEELVCAQDIANIMGREAIYLEAVYDFQREMLNKTEPERRHEISDQLSEFVRYKRELFWDKAKMAASTYINLRIDLRKSFREYISLSGGYGSAEVVLELRIEDISNDFAGEYPSP